MEEATLGVILFTKDIMETLDTAHSHFSRPNIYFEYGFLSSHIKKVGNPIERITLFVERGLTAATDFQDVGRFDYSNNEFVNYLVLVERIMLVNQTLTQMTSKIVLDKCIDRLQEAFNTGRIGEADLKGKKFSDFKNEVKSKLMEIISRRFPSKKLK